MSHFSRGARVAARTGRQLADRQTRRFDSHHASHGSGESAFDVAGGTGKESFGVSSTSTCPLHNTDILLQKGLYIAVALVPISMVAYSVVNSDENNFITRTINAYKFREETWDLRNTLHETALRQAAHDRNLLMTQPMDQTGPDLSYPEYAQT